MSGSGLRTFARILAVLVAAGALLVAMAPGIVYALALVAIGDRPVPADPATYPHAGLVAAWRVCERRNDIVLSPTNPWSLTLRLLGDDAGVPFPGAIAAHQVAAGHNIKRPRSGMWRSHRDNVALSLWISRHWTADQFAATLVRDGRCRPRDAR